MVDIPIARAPVAAGQGGGWTAHGDPNSAIQAFINLPLIEDTLAVRAVIYNDRRGCYINNVPGTFARQPTDGGIATYFNGVVPANSPTLSNSNLVGNAINPVTYTGARASLFYKFNDDWNALIQTPDTTAVCYSPSATWHNIQRNTHQSHELRASTPDDWRVRGLFGLFWEDYKIQSSQNFAYGDEEAGFAPFGPIGGVTVFDPSERPSGTVFFSDLTRGYKQRAAYRSTVSSRSPSSTTAIISRTTGSVGRPSGSSTACSSMPPCIRRTGRTCSSAFMILRCMAMRSSLRTVRTTVCAASSRTSPGARVHERRSTPERHSPQ